MQPAHRVQVPPRAAVDHAEGQPLVCWVVAVEHHDGGPVLARVEQLRLPVHLRCEARPVFVLHAPQGDILARHGDLLQLVDVAVGDDVRVEEDGDSALGQQRHEEPADCELRAHRGVADLVPHDLLTPMLHGRRDDPVLARAPTPRPPHQPLMLEAGKFQRDDLHRALGGSAHAGRGDFVGIHFAAVPADEYSRHEDGLVRVVDHRPLPARRRHSALRSPLWWFITYLRGDCIHTWPRPLGVRLKQRTSGQASRARSNA